MLLARGTIDGGCTARVAATDMLPAALTEEWAALAIAAAEPNAFAEPWFVDPALRYLRGDQTVRIVETRDATGRLTGVLPLCIARRYGRIPLRNVTNWAHFQCFMGTPLVRAGYEQAFWRAVLDLLDESDWARNFLTVTGLWQDGPLHRALQALDRPVATVHCYQRAALASALDGEAYLHANVRAKKRKELRRLASRLGDDGTVTYRALDRPEELTPWCDDFLRLEAAGWKGSGGSAFANEASTEAFFRSVVAGAFAADRLDFQRLNLDGRAIAMLINFRTPPGSWSFKIAYDEAYARFSPGVMIELENLRRVLADPEVEWMDSCAVENHPMIDKLWAERRAIVQVTLPLKGAKRRAAHALARGAERAAAMIKGLHS